MISENINMQRVSIPEATATHSLPKITRVCAPTPAAPIVLAIVFTVNIAASGLLIFSFSSAISLPDVPPSFSITDTCAIERLSRTDSSREQRNETNSAVRK